MSITKLAKLNINEFQVFTGVKDVHVGPHTYIWGLH